MGSPGTAGAAGMLTVMSLGIVTLAVKVGTTSPELTTPTDSPP